MQIFLITAVVFALAMLAFGLVSRKAGGKHECSCKKAAHLMARTRPTSCSECSDNKETPLLQLNKEPKA